MNLFVPGQRWFSESEPELGLGTVLAATGGQVKIEFKTAGETRLYASDQAPLKRVRFRVGDKIHSANNKDWIVREVVEQHGLLIYLGEHHKLPEAQLSDRIELQGPRERLFAGRFDASEAFLLRRRSLELLHRARRSPVRGLLGGRIDLIPHQIYIAHEVANRHAPRVMLSDEVGLGKTIEACLILHRLLLSGRASRILVLVPESLVHQWFVEMLRRFNVQLQIFDMERCAAIEAGDRNANPFLEDQLVITNIEFLAGNPHQANQAIAAGWDILVVDEAHHLKWSEAAPSKEYQIVQALSRQADGLLLLTATPEQLGVESHFARLRLLDPDRYQDLAAFEAASNNYGAIADLAEKVQNQTALTKQEMASLRNHLAKVKSLTPILANFEQGNPDARQTILANLLDFYGPGRVLFRNTRSSVKGFPKRTARLAKLDSSSEAELWLDRVSTEFAADVGDSRLQPSLDFARDPRLLWLVNLLKALGSQKVLLIARSVEKAEAIDEALRQHMAIRTGIFHEGLTLLQRDRQAAWFAESEGAQLLLCSEIGSEGRNFQFSHHLVLFDLPQNPELLEQRIGRLDRIGQTHDIEIHVPYLAHSPQEVLARWYHEGLNAFAKNLEGGNELFQEFGRAVHDLALEFPVAERSAAEVEMTALLKTTRSVSRNIRRRLEEGRDRLLELNSLRPAIAEKIIHQIQEADRQPDLEHYLLEIFDHFGVHAEQLAPHTWQLNPQGIITDSFPAMPVDGMVATCDRHQALSREDVAFLTWDHPMVTGAMELLLGGATGNCAFAIWPTTNDRTLLLECIFVLECVAPARLHADRFLPPTPVPVVLTHKLADVTDTFYQAERDLKLQKASAYKLMDNADIVRRIIPSMFEFASQLAEKRADQFRKAALSEMDHILGHEVQRLKTLQTVNDHVRAQEINLAQDQQNKLTIALHESRLRLDAVRMIWKGPPETLR